MSTIIKHIKTIDGVICKNIEKFDVTERGILSQNVLSQLRNFVEHIALKILGEAQNKELESNYEKIKEAVDYLKARGDLKFLKKFHKLLQITASHYTLNEENSERLMLKYYEYLIRTKLFLKQTYDLEVLCNINEFPIKIDSNLKEYYEKIAKKINIPESNRSKSTYNDRYYIQKIKPFFIKSEIYYEVTFTRANDYVSKFDRIIAFTKLDISENYAVKLSISKDSINILGKNMPIQIIDNWEVSIRPCELDNFAKILGVKSKVSGNKETYELMKYLKNSGTSLVELIDLTDWYYDYIKEKLTKKAKISRFFKLLDKCREMSKQQSDGSNIVRYLLYRLNNKIIKKQYYKFSCEKLSNLYVGYGCIPFDKMPFNTSLINHNPKLHDLLNSINACNRKHEILARHIKNNTEQKGQLYTPIENLNSFENIENLIEQWNNSLYWKHTGRRIETYKNHLYIKEYEEDTFSIIEKLKNISSSGIKNYKNSITSWLKSSSYQIDSEEKETSIKQMFENSKVALIYGAAGTGKSTMINHISNFFNDDKKLYLANTNPAVDNLKRKINAANCTFKTITKYNWDSDKNYDILIIDECSTVSNSDILKVLNSSSFRLLVLVGDTFQIESILFGNWFSLARYFIPKSSVFELLKPYRSNNKNLLELWSRVRNIQDNITESLAKNQYSASLDNSIFENTQEDEIILCLNYDGLYGINNINSFLQSSNDNIPHTWGTHTYKVNDPIIFNESGRFSPLIYNNLKGKIIQVLLLEDKIQFDTEINIVINEYDSEGYDFELLDNAENGNSIIRFYVDKYKSTDDDDDDDSSNTVVPFQVAYAVSIHKAQGLEYKSVKVVITDEVEEMISHNILYTAITRAREDLRIYWTPETENKILRTLINKFNKKDLSLLKSKYNF